MGSFSKIDIFDTKGIEYLIVIGYLIALIIFWKLSNKQVSKKIQEVLGNISANILRIPQGLFYNNNHTWAHLEESGAVKVGMDDFLQHVTGKVDFIHLENPGEVIKKGSLLTEVDQEGKRLRIFSPVSGKIISTNESLYEDPGILNEDPYEKGWIYKIKPSNWIAETKSYFLAEEATNWSEKELERFKDFIAKGAMKKYSSEPSMVVLQDGGELRDHILSQLPDEIWSDFQKEFLDSTSQKS